MIRFGVPKAARIPGSGSSGLDVENVPPIIHPCAGLSGAAVVVDTRNRPDMITPAWRGKRSSSGALAGLRLGGEGQDRDENGNFRLGQRLSSDPWARTSGSTSLWAFSTKRLTPRTRMPKKEMGEASCRRADRADPRISHGLAAIGLRRHDSTRAARCAVPRKAARGDEHR